MSIVNDNMSETPETDDQPIINAINDNGYQVPCVDIKYARKLERERDEALESLKHIGEYGTEEINAAVELRQKLASALVERDEVQKAVNGLCKHLGVSPANTTLLAVEVLKIERERDEANEEFHKQIVRYDQLFDEAEKIRIERNEALEQAQRLRVQLNHYSQVNEMAELAFRERDEARKEIENVKLQLGLWEDGNLICEETRGEIRLFEEQIKQALLERNKAYKIAEQAIEDLAWFNETNAQRLRNKLEQLKEETK